MSPVISPGVGATPDRAPNWAWGSSRQLWACRISHVLGLIAVLLLLLAVGAAQLP